MASSKGGGVADRLFSVEGKSVLVTGASSGIGREISLLFAEAGANVIVAARKKQRLEELLEDIRKLSGAEAKAVELDVSGSEESVSAAIDQAWSSFGRIDILINNAGAMVPSTSLEATVDAYEHQFGVNVRGAWLVARTVAKHQVADGRGGSIVNTASVSAEIIKTGVPLYSASKSALITLTKHMARELGHSGIRVNAINPGFFASDLTNEALKLESVQKTIKKFPIGRPGDTTRELHGAVLLLASDAGSYITGTTITVDGGSTLMYLSYADQE